MSSEGVAPGPKSALVLLDYQSEFLDPSGRMPVARAQVEPMIAATLAAMAAFKVRSRPIVTVGNAFRRGDFVRNLLRRFASLEGSPGAAWDARVPLDGTIYFPKWAASAFVNAEFERCLRREGVEEIVLGGMFASACVSATAKAALARGFRVRLLESAIACARATAARRARWRGSRAPAPSSPPDAPGLGAPAPVTQAGAEIGGDMSDLSIGVGVCVLTFLFGYGGMRLQKHLPEAHMTSGARDMIGAVMGLIALLLALVLGTLIGSAYGFYATQKANVETMSARAIQLDMAFKQFGPEAAELRAGMEGALGQAYRAIWVENMDPRAYGVAPIVQNFERLNEGAALLQAKNPEQMAAIPTINASIGIIEQTRLLMSLQLASPISWPLLFVVVSWAMLLFAGYGVLARLNGTAVIAALVGAFAIGSAVLLILELNTPFSGVFRIPATAMEQTLAVLNK